MFLLRKVAAFVLMPLPLVLLTAMVGGLLWWRAGERRRLRRAGQGLVGVAWLGLLMASSTPLARAFVGPLEARYPAFPGDSVAYVVVLGGGHASAPGIPLTAVPDPQSLYRLTEGVRIATAQPWSTLVTSAFSLDDPRTSAGLNRELAIALGLDSARIHAEPSPRTTSEEARVLAPLLRGEPFALVTSATHMARAVTLFRREGLDPVPAPTGHMVKDRPGGSVWDLVPSADALRITRQGWYELLARVPAALGG